MTWRRAHSWAFLFKGGVQRHQLCWIANGTSVEPLELFVQVELGQDPARIDGAPDPDPGRQRFFRPANTRQAQAVAMKKPIIFMISSSNKILSS